MPPQPQTRKKKDAPASQKKANLTPQLLPTTMEELRQRGWSQADIILVTADAYVDHPSFGAAIIGRWLENLGCRVAVLAQPDWRSVEPFRTLGPPALFWGITSGAVDSRLNRYGSLGHCRNSDVYSPGGRPDRRPDRPLSVYAARARQAFKGVPIILGGLEASLRRLVHYDYIEDQLKRPVLIDAKADLLVHGMGERAIGEIARRLRAGQSIRELSDVPGTSYVLRAGMAPPSGALRLPSLADQQNDPEVVMRAQLMYQSEARPGGTAVLQETDAGNVVVLPPADPLTTEQLDQLYDLPFTRNAHPSYDRLGPVPALETVRFSITSHRGCFGGCNFCSLYFHQGKTIASRSVDSILAEADRCRRHPAFRGTISDVGGPTANMYGFTCSRSTTCQRASCLFPSVCKYLPVQAKSLIMLMESLVRWSEATGANVFVASGVRHDLALTNRDYLGLLLRHFVGGHLKVAPEHHEQQVLARMGKPPFELYEQFEEVFADLSRRAGKQQYLVPYFMSGHPGCRKQDALALTEYLVARGLRLRQVQDFTPIPLSASAAMYVSEKDASGRPLYVPRGRSEKRLQMSLLAYHDKRSEGPLRRFLQSQGRQDLWLKIKPLQQPPRTKSKTPPPDGQFE